MSDSIRLEELENGAVWRIVLATPPANILDAEKIRALSELFIRGRDEQHLKAILIEGEGGHFSFGASVSEHLPDQYRAMLQSFHAMFRELLRSGVITLAVVRGRCLGGGLELASFCHRVFASRDAAMGQPEIVLGVLAPMASVFLTERIGRSQAEDLCLTGRTLDAHEAHRIGLVDELADDPGPSALAYVRKYFLPRSASSLRLAARAVRADYEQRFGDELTRVERLYSEELMATRDAVEGLEAFLAKREPEWCNA